MNRIFAIAASAGVLAACQTPQSVKTLARSSSSLITETRGASPAVQQYFAKQDRAVESRIARWNQRRQRANSLTASHETLWAIDKKPDDKGRSELIAHIRSGTKVDPLDPPKSVSPQIADPASIAKMTGLLETIAGGKAESAGFYIGYWQALSKAMDKLNEDAAAAKSAPPGGGSDTETGGD
jgi:hypothetical protein